MPTTPVGQIQYPQGTDKPQIPADMKTLASGTDGWVSSMDMALQGRLAAVSSRLGAVATRLAVVNTASGTANTNMTSGDTAIATEQNAVGSVLARLAMQDTAAAALQTRYTTDNNELNNFRNFTPSGALGAAAAFSNNVINDSSGSIFTIGGFNLTVNAPAPSWRVSFVIPASIAMSDTNGLLELRICTGSPTASWNNTSQGTFLARQGNSNTVPVLMSAPVSGGTMRNVPFQIAVLIRGKAGYRVSANVQDATLQYLQSGGF
jgi:hypothetical protein